MVRRLASPVQNLSCQQLVGANMRSVAQGPNQPQSFREMDHDLAGSIGDEGFFGACI